MKKYYAIVVDEKEYQLRLTVGGQRRLGEKYKTSPMEVLTTAAANAGMTADVLNEALHWNGNPNGKITGDEFYDLLVDEAVLDGIGGAGELISEIGKASGMLSEEQGDAFAARISKEVDGIFLGSGEKQEEENENPPQAQTAD